jgi:hypothetical protein
VELEQLELQDLVHYLHIHTVELEELVQHLLVVHQLELLEKQEHLVVAVVVLSLLQQVLE